MLDKKGGFSLSASTKDLVTILHKTNPFTSSATCKKDINTTYYNNFLVEKGSFSTQKDGSNKEDPAFLYRSTGPATVGSKKIFIWKSLNIY